MIVNSAAFADRIGWRILDLIAERSAAKDSARKLFRIYTMPERLIVVFDPEAILLKKVGEDFTDHLKTRSGGRRITFLNHRCVIFQVSYEKPSLEILPAVAPRLDLMAQPSPLHIPVGPTAKGPLWISLPDSGSIFVAGSTGTGKSRWVHGAIQALLRGGEAEVWATDGKRGAEFGRYLGQLGFRYVDLSAMRRELDVLEKQLEERLRFLTGEGWPSLLEYNAAQNDNARKMHYVAFVIDEVADVQDDVIREKLAYMVGKYRASGLFPIFATNNPTKAAVWAKSNLLTRISFAVPSYQDSMTILGYPGAQDLLRTPNRPGRGLIVWNTRLTEFQSYAVPVPMPTEETKARLAEILKAAEGQTAEPEQNSAEALAERIRAKYMPGMSKSEVSRLLEKPYAGQSWIAKVEKVIAILSSTTTENGADYA